MKRGHLRAYWFVRAIETWIREPEPGVASEQAVDVFGDRLTKAEVAFLERAATHPNTRIWRNDWPDFLLQNEATDRFYAVEVKTNNDCISEAQRRIFAALEAAHLPVYIWNPSRHDRLTPWRAYDAHENGLPFSPKEQADIFSLWRNGDRGLRDACSRFGVSYDTVATCWLVAKSSLGMAYAKTETNHLTGHLRPSGSKFHDFVHTLQSHSHHPIG